MYSVYDYSIIIFSDLLSIIYKLFIPPALPHHMDIMTVLGARVHIDMAVTFDHQFGGIVNLGRGIGGHASIQPAVAGRHLFEYEVAEKISPSFFHLYNQAGF